MNKIIGLICAFAAEDWIELAIEQALEYTDDVILNIGAYTKAVAQNEDRTLEKAMKYKKYVTFVDATVSGKHWTSKAPTLNAMMHSSKYFDVDNWVWMFDVDEYYLKKEVDNMKANIFNSDYNCVQHNEKYFFINMRKYLTNVRKRMYKISDLDNKFRPTNKWTGPKSNIYYAEGNGMFHYSMLCNMYAKLDLWKTERWSEPRENHPLVDWCNKIYFNFDLDDEEYWIEENAKLYGVKTPYWIGDMEADENGHLYDFNGSHPHGIEAADLPKIEDFRKLYEKN